MDFKKLTNNDIKKIKRFAFETLGFNKNDIITFFENDYNKFNFININLIKDIYGININKYSYDDLFGFYFGKNTNYFIVKFMNYYQLRYNNCLIMDFESIDDLFNELYSNINEIKHNL
jgi:hypothetical protein